MHPVALAQVLTLLALANGAPVLAKKILGARFAWPLDFGMELADGARLFGASKTIRGVVGAVLAGDLLSSFLKRRLHRPPSSQALGIDQIPESLLPLLAGADPLGLTMRDIVAGVVIFFVGELLLSRLLFRLHLRDRPY